MNLRKRREQAKLNQSEFWRRIGISQSGGSRYENENRQTPETVRLLLDLAYGDASAHNKALKQLRP